MRKKNVKVFFIKSSGIFIPITISEIKWIMTKGNNCIFYLDNGKTHSIRSSLAKLLISLSQSSDTFVQCHRNFLINCNSIESYDPTGFLVIAGEQIPISKNYKKSLEAKLSFFRIA